MLFSSRVLDVAELGPVSDGVAAQYFSNCGRHSYDVTVVNFSYYDSPPGSPAKHCKTTTNELQMSLAF